MTGSPQHSPESPGGHPGNWLEVLRAFLRLGLTSFGGPVAHLGYYRTEFVERRKWISETSFVDLVAVCQFLPGPASTQTAMSIGLLRAGFPGAVCAWIGFAMPSALLLIAFGYGVVHWAGDLSPGWLHGLKVVAVAVVANALWGMARALCPDAPRASMAIVSACVVLAFGAAWAQVGTILLGGIAGILFLRSPEDLHHAPLGVRISAFAGGSSLLLFGLLLLALPLLVQATGDPLLALVDSFYRTGSLVFGGGHVVLPLLQSEVVPPGWVSRDAFVAGYGAAQAVPGPLFTFSAYLGTVMNPAAGNGWVGGWVSGLIALVAIFAPSFLLIVGVLPFWERLRRYGAMRSAMLGVNAAVVGLLLAALYDPVWTSAVLGPADFGLALAAFGLLAMWRVPPWLVVLLTAAGGAGLHALATL